MYPIQPHSSTEPSTASTSAKRSLAASVQRPQRTLFGGFAALSLITMLFVAFAGCSFPSTSALVASSSTSKTVQGQTTAATSATTTKTSATQKSVAAAPQATLTIAGPSMLEVAQSTTLDSVSSGSVTATCPAGDYALGGGWSLPTPAFGVSAAYLNGASWTVSLHPLGRPEFSHIVTLTVTAYVECLTGATGAVVTQRGRTVSEPPTPDADILASPCLANESPVGFGFDFGSAGATMEFAGAYPFFFEGVTEWSFHVTNHDTVAHPVTAYVECLAKVTIPKFPGHPALGSVSVSVSESFPQTDGGPIPAGATGSLLQPCPSGTMLAAGGFDYPSGGNGNLYLLHATPRGWEGAVYALSGSTGLSLLEEAICISLQ